MSRAVIGPTGAITVGHVLDVAKKPLERALRDYDPQLYVKWNPKKLRKWGCWEIRRRPNEKDVIEIVDFEGMSFVKIGYREIDIVNHVLDLPYLNYEAITKIKAMDTWNGNRNFWAEQLEGKEAEYREEVKRKAKEETRYMARAMRKDIQALKQALLSGLNPALIAETMGKLGQ